MAERTFAGIPAEFSKEDTSEIYLQSVPYDGTSSWGKGADKGFEAFLHAAQNMELYDIETDSEVYHKGIYLMKELKGYNTPEEMFKDVYNHTQKQLLKDKFLTFFGGEHSISIGIIKAFYEHFDNLTVLQIDAHADLREQYEGSRYNHACAVYDASKNCNLIQVGIRSMDVSEKEHMDCNKTFFDHDISGKSDWMDQAISLMTEPVYITVDLDAFDPGIMPATGTPEPGGLRWNTAINFLKKVFSERNVVGFDIVELAPIDGFHAPEFLAAKLYYKMLSYKFHL